MYTLGWSPFKACRFSHYSQEESQASKKSPGHSYTKKTRISWWTNRSFLDNYQPLFFLVFFFQVYRLQEVLEVVGAFTFGAFTFYSNKKSSPKNQCFILGRFRQPATSSCPVLNFLDFQTQVTLFKQPGCSVAPDSRVWMMGYDELQDNVV